MSFPSTDYIWKDGIVNIRSTARREVATKYSEYTRHHGSLHTFATGDGGFLKLYEIKIMRQGVWRGAGEHWRYIGREGRASQ